MAKRLTARDLRALGYEQRNGQWTRVDISRRRPNAVPKSKRTSKREAFKKAGINEANKKRQPGSCKYFIVVIARTLYETDPDNLIAKWSIDCLIGAVIPGDSSRDIIGVLKSVEEIRMGEPEETIIEVWKVT